MMDQNKAPIATSNDKENLNSVKKPTSRKPPVIKQTLTSMYRIAKANPLLLLKHDKTSDTNDFGLSSIKKLPKSVFEFGTSSTCDSDKLTIKEKLNNKEQANVNVQKPTVTKSKVNTDQKFQLNPAPLSRTSSLRVNKEKPAKTNVQLQRSNSVKVATFKYTNGKVQNNLPSSTKPAVISKTETNKSVHTDKTKRRSLSAEHYERKRKLSKPKIEQLIEKKEITQSLTDIEKKICTAPFVSPIVEERKVTFKTPSAYNRRSVSYYTPTPFKRHHSISFASTPGPALNDLQDRLEKWFQKHKKPAHSYHHLKCFGIKHIPPPIRDEENKENIEETESASSSYEDLKILSPIENSDVPVINEPEPDIPSGNMQSVARTALNDLHKLILDGYCREQCEAWLGMIRSKYRNLEEEPQYWECRAAIEQTRGNITSAVECLRTAIVQGAEVQSVDQSLEQLLQKFSLLNISTMDSSISDEDKIKKDRAKIILDARNVFKSSIIQFAVQERTMKKKQQKGEITPQAKYIVTPVRRTTRRSQSRYALTPGIQLCSSLRELDDSVRDKINFQNNSALSVDYPKV